MRRIYFAGSIRGGREDADWYDALIVALAARASVLTEHVADPERADSGRSDREIYERDVAWLGSADAVVAEVTVPSMGVGYELGLAEALGKPVLCLYRTDAEHRLSAMVGGNDRFNVATYRSVDEAVSAIDDFLGGLTD